MVKRLQTQLALYLSLFICLCLSACTTAPPYQDLSNAKQALIQVENLFKRQQPTSRDNEQQGHAQSAYQKAKQLLSQRQHAQATQQAEYSIHLSQQILKRHNAMPDSPANPPSNVRFRH